MEMIQMPGEAVYPRGWNPGYTPTIQDSYLTDPARGLDRRQAETYVYQHQLNRSSPLLVSVTHLFGEGRRAGRLCWVGVQELSIATSRLIRPRSPSTRSRPEKG